MAFLLDINVLIALMDPGHVLHDRAHRWFAATGRRRWASCPMTEAGVVRIVGHPRYPNSPGSPAAVVPLLSGLVALPGHEFWPDDVSLLDGNRVQGQRLLQSSQVTDSYLLALARAHGGALASFDAHLVTAAVPGGAETLHLIP
ncbi:MAG: TA system VapC family ribonuclease toxin [Terriglobales bacterium]